VPPADKQLQRVARRRRYGRVVNLGCQLLDTVNALGRDNAKLGKMRPQGGREHRDFTGTKRMVARMSASAMASASAASVLLRLT
jgi:hypothetical protein